MPHRTRCGCSAAMLSEGSHADESILHTSCLPVRRLPADLVIIGRETYLTCAEQGSNPGVKIILATFTLKAIGPAGHVRFWIRAYRISH